MCRTYKTFLKARKNELARPVLRHLPARSTVDGPGRFLICVCAAFLVCNLFFFLFLLVYFWYFPMLVYVDN